MRAIKVERIQKAINAYYKDHYPGMTMRILYGIGLGQCGVELFTTSPHGQIRTFHNRDVFDSRYRKMVYNQAIAPIDKSIKSIIP